MIDQLLVPAQDDEVITAPATMQSAAMLERRSMTAPATMQSAAMLRSGAV
jgi:hypothetical protein